MLQFKICCSNLKNVKEGLNSIVENMSFLEYVTWFDNSIFNIQSKNFKNEVNDPINDKNIYGKITIKDKYFQQIDFIVDEIIKNFDEKKHKELLYFDFDVYLIKMKIGNKNEFIIKPDINDDYFSRIFNEKSSFCLKLGDLTVQTEVIKKFHTNFVFNEKEISFLKKIMHLKRNMSALILALLLLQTANDKTFEIKIFSILDQEKNLQFLIKIIQQKIIDEVYNCLY